MNSPRFLLRVFTSLFTAFVSVGLPSLTLAAGAPGTSDISRPAKITTPSLDSTVVESREKVDDQYWAGQLTKADAGGPKKVLSSDVLDAQATKGDARAATLKANTDRKDKDKAAGRGKSAQEKAALDVLYTKGMADGLPDAFVAKAELEWANGDAHAAALHAREGSNRGSAAADLKLAEFKARRPELTEISESAVALLNRAADRGDAQAALALGIALGRGAWEVDKGILVGCKPAPEQGLAWIERAALLGSSEAELWLGVYYMKHARGLVDPVRQKAVDCLLAVRRAGGEVKDPVSGKTFAQLESEGVFEEGLLGEIKRREKDESDTVTKSRSDKTKQKIEANPSGTQTAQRIRVDHQMLEILGDSTRRTAVYNLIGLSPYKEIAGEGSIRSATGDRIVASAGLPSLAQPLDWTIDVLDGDTVVAFRQVKSVDQATNTIRTGTTLPTELPKTMRYRLVRNHTFFSTFGQHNEVGMRPGVDGTDADEILVFDPRRMSLRRFFYHEEQGQWFEVAAKKPLAADFDLPAGVGLIVKRIEAASLLLQVRGSVPSTAFDFVPGRGVSLVSIRKNKLAGTLASAASATSIQKASDLSVVTRKGNGWAEDKKPKGTPWWALLGLSASDQVHVVNDSAAVLVNN